MAANEVDAAELEIPPRLNEFRRVVGVFLRRPVALVGLVIIVALIIIAIFAPFMTPYDPYKVTTQESLLQPSWEHLLGTDFLGRDLLTRILYGSRTSLIIGIGAVGVGSAIGQLLGLIAAYFGGWIDQIIMRVMDALMAFPMIILFVIMAAMLGTGMVNLIIALSIGMVPGSARLIRSEVLRVKETDYVLAAQSLGASSFRIMLKEVYPNTFAILLVNMSIMMGGIILAEAGISFIGLGLQPPSAAWGRMVNDGYKFLLNAPLVAIMPGVAIMLVCFGFNMMGDGLRDALDPRLRGVV